MGAKFSGEALQRSSTNAVEKRVPLWKCGIIAGDRERSSKNYGITC